MQLTDRKVLSSLVTKVGPNRPFK